MSNEQQSGKMWSGRFREPLDAEFEAWQRSIVFDWRLLDEEIAASKAHASALCAAGILTESETAELRDGAGRDCRRARIGRRQGAGARSPVGRRHSSLRRTQAGRAHRLARAQAAHRPQPQRADRHRPAPLCARANRARQSTGSPRGPMRSSSRRAPPATR